MNLNQSALLGTSSANASKILLQSSDQSDMGGMPMGLGALSMNGASNALLNQTQVLSPQAIQTGSRTKISQSTNVTPSNRRQNNLMNTS
jgi:hypothetical protein